MKKFCKYLTLILIILTLSACGEKKVLSTSEVLDELYDKGFTVIDVTSQMEDKNITHVSSANNGNYQVEYYVFTSEEKAKKAYESNKEAFENNKTKGKEKNGKTYQKYTQKLSDTYNILVTTNNILIYSSVNIEYKNDLNRLIKDLGY